MWNKWTISVKIWHILTDFRENISCENFREIICFSEIFSNICTRPEQMREAVWKTLALFAKIFSLFAQNFRENKKNLVIFAKIKMFER
jgi:hypothetical protein